MPQSEPLSQEELLRYSRHLTLPQVGVEGQGRLKAAKVVVIGAGGLGSPLVLYLAAAGVGTIGIVDFDSVDTTNLQRQVLYGTTDVGKPKVESAVVRLKDLNPLLKIVCHSAALTSNNALQILGDYDVVVDGTDNFATRYLVNDACGLLGLPNVYGSVFRFEGQVSVFHPGADGPCYRCLYPEPPPPDMAPNCAEGGVLGVLPGVIGTLQATEVIKLILGVGEPLLGRLLMYDALAARFREWSVKRSKSCPLCGDEPSIKELIDYEQFCGTKDTDDNIKISHQQLEALWKRGERPTVIDVREPHEWEVVNLEREFNAVLVPLAKLESHFERLDKASDIVVYCKSGGRSKKAVETMRAAGYSKALSLTGGIMKWCRDKG